MELRDCTMTNDEIIADALAELNARNWVSLLELECGLPAKPKVYADATPACPSPGTDCPAE